MEEGKEGRVSKEMSHHLLRREVPALGAEVKEGIDQGNQRIFPGKIKDGFEE